MVNRRKGGDGKQGDAPGCTAFGKEEGTKNSFGCTTKGGRKRYPNGGVRDTPECNFVKNTTPAKLQGCVRRRGHKTNISKLPAGNGQMSKSGVTQDLGGQGGEKPGRKEEQQ